MCKGFAVLQQTCLERAKHIKVKFGTLLQRSDHEHTENVIPFQKKPENVIPFQKKPENAIPLPQKPENAIPLPQKPERCLETPQKYDRPSRAEASQWGKALDKVLTNNYGLATFRGFLRSEFSEENIEFWVACEDYKRTRETSKMAAKAKRIYKEFIQTGAHWEVNIDHITKDVTVRNLGRLTPMTFDLAQRQVFALMEKDSYRRFLKSNQYQEIIK
ncbi:regulator of G-protein signaling 5-like isoform X1 [Oncorhynchus nerka]|uniref:regulator of G-protein signaling 5-like isoform X1 n=1 Tax=Oncorhynchus nerka TaxID=8023 RepID=UPI001131C0D1|nr:regulator of G-protein signaling 5-like isoform X1 [Oncorhynchus nerka]